MRTPIGVVDERGITDVYGTGGSVRHSGAISKNNPYYSSLMMASNNQDKDALYELAIQWEADNANLQEQREYDRKVLEEQREYDSPLSQVQRAREAGINMDLTGGSGSGSGVSSGSSAQLTPREIDDQTGQTKFKNSYDTANTVFNGINTAANVIGVLTSGATQLMDGISKLRLLGSQRELVEAQTNEISSLLSGKKFDQTTRQISMLSGMLHNGFKDEDSTALYDMYGIDENERAGYNNAIRMIHERPEVLSAWQENEIGNRASSKRSEVYNSEYFSRIIPAVAQAEESSVNNRLYISLIEESLNRILSMDPDYASNQAESLEKTAELGVKHAEQAYREFTNYCNSYGERIDYAASRCKDIDNELSSYDLKKGIYHYTKNGQKYARKMAEADYGYVDSLKDTRMLITYGAANDMMIFTNALNNFSRQAYLKSEMINKSTGELLTLNGRQSIAQFTQGMFGDVINGVKSGGDIVKDAVTTVGNIFAMIYGMKAAGTLSNANNSFATPKYVGGTTFDVGYSTTTGMIPIYQSPYSR